MLGLVTPEELVAIPELEPLYAELAAFLDVPRDALLLTAGSDAGLKSVFEVFVGEDDEVVLPHPTFDRYTELTSLYGARTVPVSIGRDLDYPLHEIAAALCERTRLVVIVNPHSPTGAVADEPGICTVVERAQEAGALVLVDEAYHHFCDVTVVPRLARFENLVITRTFSKAFGALAARIGVLLATPRLVEELRKVQVRSEISGISARIARYLLAHPQVMRRHVAMVTRSRARLPSLLGPLGLQVYPSGAPFVLVEVPPATDRDEFVRGLAATGFEVGGKLQPPFERCVKVGVGPWSQMVEFADACAHVLDELGAAA
jgi:histidinol-phosphate aminotransferase